MGPSEETIHTLVATECDFIQHEVDKMLYARHGYIAFLNRRLAVKMIKER